MASDEYGNHGCNDFYLTTEANFTLQEAIKIDKFMNEWNGTPEDHNPKYANESCDFALMRY